MFGMVGLMSAWVWARDLLKYQGIRQEQGEEDRSTLKPIESISRNVPTRLELWYSGAIGVNCGILHVSRQFWALNKKQTHFF